MFRVKTQVQLQRTYEEEEHAFFYSSNRNLNCHFSGKHLTIYDTNVLVFGYFIPAIPSLSQQS